MHDGAVVPQRRAMSEPHPGPLANGRETNRILVVDDEPDITFALKIGLDRHGFSVDAYNNPILAVEKYIPGRYKLAILDVRMPELTGFEVARRLRKKDAEVKIWVMTAFDINQKEFDTLFAEARINGFIEKPITLSKLASLIRQDQEGMRVARMTRVIQ